MQRSIKMKEGSIKMKEGSIKMKEGSIKRNCKQKVTEEKVPLARVCWRHLRYVVSVAALCLFRMYTLPNSSSHRVGDPVMSSF